MILLTVFEGQDSDRDQYRQLVFAPQCLEPQLVQTGIGASGAGGTLPSGLPLLTAVKSAVALSLQEHFVGGLKGSSLWLLLRYSLGCWDFAGPLQCVYVCFLFYLSQ